MSYGPNKNSKHTASSLIRNNLGWIIFFTVAIAVASVIVLKVANSPHQTAVENDTDTSAPQVSVTPTEPPTPVESDEPASDDTSDSPAESDSKTPTQYEGKIESDTITADITYSSYVSDTYVLRVTIEQLLSSGKCTITLKNGSFVYQKEADIITNPASSACDGFSVPRSELAKSGDYTVEVKITSGNETTTIDHEINIP